MGFLTRKERYGNIIMDKEYIVVQWPFGEFDIDQIKQMHETIS